MDVDSSSFAAGSLKELFQIKFKENRVVFPLAKGGTVRSSGFGQMCPREEVLAALHKVIREENFNADQLLNFSLGTDFHSLLQDEVLPKVGAMVGEWKCYNCGKKFGGMGKKKGFYLSRMIPKPAECSKCKCLKLTYVEQFLTDVEYGITGHPDGFINIPGRAGTGVIEAKSIGGKGAWEIKKVPKFEHVIQVQLYLWMTNLPWACILYWDKGTFGLNGITEYFIERDEATIEAIKENLKLIWNGIDGGPLPERICSSLMAPRAVTCALRNQCFETEIKNDNESSQF